MEPLVTIAANADCELAENPLWHPEQRCVYWTDIPEGKIYCLDISTAKYRTIYQGPPVGGFTLQDNDSLLLWRRTVRPAFHNLSAGGWGKNRACGLAVSNTFECSRRKRIQIAGEPGINYYE